MPLNFLRQFLFLVLRMPTCAAVFVMFGGYWSLLPALLGRLLRKKVFIILGGTDCVSFPSLGYGSLRKPLQRWFIYQSYKNSTALLPVHESLIQSTNPLAAPSEQKQGVMHFFPKLKTPFITIHNGFSTIQAVLKKNENSFITVAGAASLMRFRLKGLDKVVELARNLPDANFTIVGCNPNLVHSPPNNLKLFDFLPYEEFKDLLSASRFYLQLSLSEGFPNALAEAMLHECIPIVSPVGGMPDIVGDTGLVLSSQTDYWANEISEWMKTLDNVQGFSTKAFEKITNDYPLDKRGLELSRLVS